MSWMQYEDVYFARAHCLRHHIMAGDMDSNQTSNFTFLHDTFTVSLSCHDMLSYSVSCFNLLFWIRRQCLNIPLHCCCSLARIQLGNLMLNVDVDCKTANFCSVHLSSCLPTSQTLWVIIYACHPIGLV